MYNKRAFIDNYKKNGVDEMEFQEADKNLTDLITENEDKEDATVGGEEVDDDQE